jgi:hypothetical protein
VSRGRKEQRHACSVIGTQQYRRMESISTNAPLANGSGGVEAVGRTGERETNASNPFKAPQAAEERETNAPCQRETAENTGTWKPTCRRKRLPQQGETEGRQPSRYSGGGRESQRPPSTQWPADCPTRLVEGRPPGTPLKQQARTLVMGRRQKSVGPTYPALPEPGRQQARRAGAGQPAAADACDVS